MAYAPLPTLVPISTSNMCPNTTLSKVLQTDQVRRLFKQPNIIIRTVPLVAAEDTISKKYIFGNNRNGTNINLNSMSKPSEICIVPVVSNEDKEDANLLPSKTEDKKSEIVLLPIKRKLCGHYEPCEDIVCEVMIQQHVDQDRVSPILAVHIEEDEINAPVAKHCKNKYCDALSIDHNRCRRVLILLYKCDSSQMCDICEKTLTGWKSRIYHRNCKRRNEYRHNNVDRAHLWRERMRERELQMIEAAKTKKKDYLDPIEGYNLAMETLQKNEELIIIPKAAPNQRPIITITSIPSTQSISTNPSNIHQSFSINSQLNKLEKSIIASVPFAIAPRGTAIRLSDDSRSEKDRTQTLNQIKLPNLNQNPYCVTSTSMSVPPLVTTQNQYVRLAAPSQTTIQPITINNWVVSPPSHGIVTIPIQPKPILTPIRVVPITNLITAPSLLHRTQGIPKFCIMTDNMLTPLAIPDPPPLQPVTITKNAVTTTAGNIVINTAPNVATNATISAVPNAPTNVIVNTATTAVINAATNATTNVVIKAAANALINAAKITGSNATTIVPAQQQYVPKVPIQPSTQKLFKSHKKSNKKPKKFCCNYCSKHFSTDWYFKMHVAKHKGEKLFCCDLCNKSFSNKYDMKRHTIKEHNNREKHRSTILSKSHIEMHTAPNSDEMDDTLEKHITHIKVERDLEVYEKFSIDETMSICTSNGIDVKSLKYKNKPVHWNKNTKIFINGIKTELHDGTEFHKSNAEEHDSKELLRVKR